MPESARIRRLRSVFAALAMVAVCFAPVGASRLAVGREDYGRYGELRPPSFAPPAWVFGAVWTVLYACMGLAAWRVWRRRGFRGARGAFALFAAQLVLNAAWPVAFFGLRSPGAGLIVIAALWLAVALTAAAFFRASRAAGWLLLPYLAWVTFAAALNAAIWRLNP